MSEILTRKKIFDILFVALLVLIIEGCGSGGSGTSTYTASAGSTGTAALSWNQVTTYTDNSSFAPAGYKVYYGTAHNTYTAVVDIPASNLVSRSSPTCTINNLSRGTYYFAVSVYDSARTESALSTEVTKIIR